jgi:hypothetical protein
MVRNNSSGDEADPRPLNAPPTRDGRSVLGLLRRQVEELHREVVLDEDVSRGSRPRTAAHRTAARDHARDHHHADRDRTLE